jgi:anti-sigma B factor antagonist
MDFGVTSSRLAYGVTLIAVTGEVDVYTAPTLRERLTGAVNDGAFRLIVDLTGVDFLDSTGLGVLVGSLKRVRAHDDGSLLLVCDAERLLKIFRITGLTKVFHIVPDLASARAWYAGRATSAALPVPDPETIGWHWVPGRIYLSEEQDHQAVQEAVEALADAFGLEVVFAFPPVAGSWFREFLLRLRNSGSLPTKEEQFIKLARGLDLHLLHKPQAEIDAAEATAVAALVQSLQNTPRAIIQTGSVLMVKVDEVLVVRNLTQLELAHWERNPALFTDPASALKELQRASSDTEVTPMVDAPDK